MSTNLTKREIVLEIYEKTSFPQKEIVVTVQMTLDIIQKALADARNVELRNFGVLQVQIRKSRIGRSTGFKLGISGTLDQDYSVTYGYDNAGRLGTVTDSNGTYTYGYLDNSRLLSSLAGSVHTTTYAYESNRDVLTSMEDHVSSTRFLKYDYTVNNVGQRTERISRKDHDFGYVQTTDFEYNTKGELAKETVLSDDVGLGPNSTSYHYDDIGNRVSTVRDWKTIYYEGDGSSIIDNEESVPYVSNGLNQYTQIYGSSYTGYDADGNMTGISYAYTWDAENRLISIAPVTPSVENKKQVNTYDGQSRRVRKQVYAYAGGSSWNLLTDEKFVYNGWNVVAVLDAASDNVRMRTYTWGLDMSGSLQGAGGVGGLLSVKDGSSVYHYTYDGNGNVSELLNSSGVVAAHYEYDGFGNVVVSRGDYNMANAYRFSTKPQDDVGGLYYYGLRYYNPNTGRWISRDPIEEKGGANLYGMVGNNPINLFDPWGLRACSEIDGIHFFEPPEELVRAMS